jgi:hypothetical protein
MLMTVLELQAIAHVVLLLFLAAIYYDTYDFDDDEMETPVVDEDKGSGEKLNALAN